MKREIITLLIAAGAFGCWADASRSDVTVITGQPSIFWRHGEWQTWNNGVWTPYRGEHARPAEGAGTEALVQPGTGSMDHNPADFRGGRRHNGRGGDRAGIVSEPGQEATKSLGAPNIGIGQPNVQIGEPNPGVGQPNGIGQTTIGIGQRNGIGQPTIGIGQPNGIGQTTIGIGQTTTAIGQPTVGIGQPNTGIGQTTIGIGQQTSGMAPPNTAPGRPRGLGSVSTGSSDQKDQSRWK